MRFLEIIVILLSLVVTLNLAIPESRRRNMAALLFITILLTLLHLFVEGYRWQMVPLYAFLGLAAWRKKREATTGFTVGASLLWLLALLLPMLIPVVKLPLPTETLSPVYGLAITATNRKDEVKISAAIAKLRDEDPSLILEQHADLHQMVLRGQGEIHLKVAVERLSSKYGLDLSTSRPQVPYQETIRKTTTQRGRHKRQHGTV